MSSGAPSTPAPPGWPAGFAPPPLPENAQPQARSQSRWSRLFSPSPVAPAQGNSGPPPFVSPGGDGPSPAASPALPAVEHRDHLGNAILTGQPSGGGGIGLPANLLGYLPAPAQGPVEAHNPNVAPALAITPTPKPYAR